MRVEQHFLYSETLSTHGSYYLSLSSHSAYSAIVSPININGASRERMTRILSLKARQQLRDAGQTGMAIRIWDL